MKKQSGLKEDFANIPVQVSQEKHRGRPRQLHALCGKNTGEENHWTLQSVGPEGNNCHVGTITVQ